MIVASRIGGCAFLLRRAIFMRAFADSNVWCMVRGSLESFCSAGQLLGLPLWSSIYGIRGTSPANLHVARQRNAVSEKLMCADVSCCRLFGHIMLLFTARYEGGANELNCWFLARQSC